MSDGLGDRTAVSPVEFSDSPLSRVLRQPLILGLFLPVQSGGWSASLLPRTTDWTFDYNAALTKRAERLGFDLVFGLAQWTSKGGYGGISKYREDSLDPFITVAALSAITDRILLISTDPRAVRPVASAPPRKIRGDDRPYLGRALGDQRRHRLFAARSAHVRRPSTSSTIAATRWPESSPTSCPGCGARPRT